MEEVIILAVIFAIFIVLTRAFYKRMIEARRFVYVSILVYLLFIYFYYELVNQINIFLRERNIFLEFGHASISLILLLIVSYLIGILTIVKIFLKKKQQ